MCVCVCVCMYVCKSVCVCVFILYMHVSIIKVPAYITKKDDTKTYNNK